MNKIIFFILLLLIIPTILANDIDGYWLFRSGERGEDGSTYCRQQEGINGNGHDVGCLWKDSEITSVEPTYCSIWVQYYFDGILDYGNQTINRMYCHVWGITKNNNLENIDYGFNIEGEYAGFSNYYHKYNSNENPPVGNAGYYNLFIYDKENFNYSREDFYNLTFIFYPKTSGRYPQILSSPKQKSFCIINPGNDTILKSKDSDNDRLSDYDEMFIYYTDPYDSNTDDDVMSDLKEAYMGLKGYDPYDDGYTKIYKLGQGESKGYLGVLNNQTIKPQTFSYKDNLDRELTDIEYNNLNRINNGYFYISSQATQNTYVLSQLNLNFKIKENIKDIKSVNIFNDVMFGFSGPYDFYDHRIQLKNEEIEGVSLGFRNFFYESFTNDLHNVVEDKIVYVKAFGIANTTSTLIHHMIPNFAEVWVTSSPKIIIDKPICKLKFCARQENEK